MNYRKAIWCKLLINKGLWLLQLWLTIGNHAVLKRTLLK